ncbi:tubulin-specific chaperone A isoform 3-T5 [Amazona ochrocephala]
MYENEVKQQEEKIKKMKAEASDDYGIKKQIELLQESQMMIPDCQRRLEAAHADLTQLLPVLIADVFHLSGHLSGSPLDPLQQVYFFPVLRTPELNTVLKEKEKELEEAEEYKEALSILESVKLEA